MLSGAEFSECRTWRYQLWRLFDGAPTVPADVRWCMFVGLNPSTADEHKDDPTIRRCVGYARDWGYHGLVMCNAYAFRSTDPSGLAAPVDAVGPDNDIWITRSASYSSLVVAAWGAGTLPSEARVASVLSAVRAAGRSVHVLKLTKHGKPNHPLYLAKDLLPQPWVTA